MSNVRSFLPRFLIVLALVGIMGFAPSSMAVDRPSDTVANRGDQKCQGSATTITNRTTRGDAMRSDDECTKKIIYGANVFGACAGAKLKCKEITITGPCDEILEDE